MTDRLLRLSKTIDKRLWYYEHPFRQFDGLSFEILNKLDKARLTVDKMRDMEAKEIGQLSACTHHVDSGTCHVPVFKILEKVLEFPESMRRA